MADDRHSRDRGDTEDEDWIGDQGSKYWTRTALLFLVGIAAGSILLALIS